jgi:uncharacterized protein YdeI (YjbR/CyaY-like superfamily)
MEITQTLTVHDKNAWRTWLVKNHGISKEIWLIFYKKATGKQTLSLTEAVDEAACFGWIDSIEKKIDEEKFALRFTPRRPETHWSKHSLERAKRLIAEGKMTKSGFETLPNEIGTNFL